MAQPAQSPGTDDARFRDGLTTTFAPFIEAAKSRGEIYIQQPYELYSEENHESWRKLYARMMPRWKKYANEHFLAGIANLCLDPNAIPRLEDVNKFLNPLTGFKAKAVAGYVPAFQFFDCLRETSQPRSRFEEVTV
jgi:phenylalanine-4-hydroxylase